jgi:hypothetical protein
MARTAPVPNFPAIPGMNPGIFVLGGGGDGGGSGGGDGNGKGGKQGANGKNGGKDANGGGKGAGACGQGSSGGCGTHKPHLQAGDPIDPSTGHVFTDSFRDFELGGNLPTHFERTYHTAAAQRDTGFGFGWTHTFAHVVEVRRRRLILWKSDGASTEFPALAVGESAIGNFGYKLERREWGYVLDCGDHRKRYFTQPVEDGSRFLLTAVDDWNGNRHSIAHSNGVIAQVTDPVGRVARFQHDARGRVASIELHDPLS